MKTLRIFSWLIVISLVLSIVPMAHSQEKYPGRPIHLIVPMAAGGGTDRVARAIAEAFKNFLPQPVLVENVAGAGSVTGMSKVHTSKPDGYTLGLASGYMISTALQGMTKYPANDFTLIAAISQDTFTFSVPAESKYKTFKEIVEASKADPDKITLANAGTGALTHLASVAMNQATGAQFRIVPFVGGAKELTALLGGHVDAGIFSMSEVLGQTGQGGKIRNLAVLSQNRTSKLADVPTLSELGVKGRIPEGPWQGLCAPKDLPDTVKSVLVEAVGKAARDPAWRDFLDKFGYTDRFMTGKEFEDFFRTDTQMLESLLKATGGIK